MKFNIKLATGIVVSLLLVLGTTTVVAADKKDKASARQATAQGPAANPRYVIQGDTVYDKKTDLTWQRCSVGQKWKDGIGCAGIVQTMTFDQAQRQGGSIWRVPTKDELPTLIDHTRVDNHQKPTIDEVAFPDMDESKLGYWTSTPYDASVGWGVVFDDGVVHGGNRSGTGAVRLVRGGQ